MVVRLAGMANERERERPGTSAPLMVACVFLCGLRPPRLHGESPRTTGPVVVRLAERANERERERTGPVYPRSWSGRRPGDGGFVIELGGFVIRIRILCILHVSCMYFACILM